ncbi:MAG: tripartite tricarboxylate transporter TctB family protein [Desulfosudis oleivorans]|nr:tripartite tricarboxylate transporter TctB family protein [Desulfosudis oleivorans]
MLIVKEITLKRKYGGIEDHGGILLLVGVFVCYQGIDLTLGAPSRPGPGFVPFGLGLFLTILAVFYLLAKSIGTRKTGSPRRAITGERPLARESSVFMPCIVNWAGYILTTFFSLYPLALP